MDEADDTTGNRTLLIYVILMCLAFVAMSGSYSGFRLSLKLRQIYFVIRAYCTSYPCINHLNDESYGDTVVVADNVHDNDVYKLLALANCDSSFFNKSGGELSIGQAQRAALARTLANEPGITYRVNFGTNIIKQIQRIADVVCLLVDGEIVEILKPDQLSTHPTAQRFLQLSS
ncbi:Hypothetical predicted protein [Olea europaea subsp. europaea]|uniref:ABC transporter domain-containing protein n=1 Tax=Olea europaea subsp. europaea TaxID=158383 RepID=A0A8S0RBV1_OLEEU|nr:Hypothetical predicted protein [Olea europaea subsp. europaea]